MRNLGTSILLFGLLLSILSCDNNDEDVSTCSDISVSELIVTNIGTLGNASDVSITFEVPLDEDCVDHYKLFIVKVEDATAFDIQVAESIDDDNSIRIDKTGANIALQLSSAAIDIDGDLIEADRSYTLFVMSVGSDEVANQLSESAQLILASSDTGVEIVVEIPIGTGGIVVDNDGNIYCADFGLASSGNSGTVRKITPEGDISVFALGFTEPSGNTIGPDGNIYQSDFSTGNVSQIAGDGSVTTFATGMTGPVGLAFDAAGNLYVANCLANTIRKVSTGGQVTTFASGSLFNCPNGITIDAAGNIYVANFQNGNLIKITPEGNSSLFATLPGNLGHILFYENKIYTIARGAHQIYEISLNGDMTKIAGNGNRGHEIGAALQSEFSLPNDLGFSPDGKYLYVNDAVQVTGIPIAPSYIKRINLD